MNHGFFEYIFIYFNWRLVYNIVLVLPYINMNLPRVYTCSPSWSPLPLPSLNHPSGSSQCTSPKHPVSCIKPRLVIRFLHDIIHVSMPFSQIIPPSPSPTESKRLFYTSVSLLLSHIQGYHYHLSKFHIYVLSCVWLFVTPWTIAYQAPPSIGFSRQGYWSGLPFPSPGDLPDPGIEPRSPALWADTLTSEPQGKPVYFSKYV